MSERGAGGNGGDGGERLAVLDVGDGQQQLRTQRLIDELWPCPPPPVDFVQRVLVQNRPDRDRPAQASTVAHQLRRRWPLLAAFAGGAAVLAIVWLALGLTRPGDPREGGEGHTVTDGRRSIRIGSRALAVAEAGSALAWSERDGAVRVEQSWGDVFYRVDRGSRFLVNTPAGQVEVTGTCFRVALQPAGQLRAERSMLVEVFEGGVQARSGTNEVALLAGQRARLAPGRIPLHLNREPGAGVTGQAGLDGVEPAAPPALADGETIDELRARERASRTRGLELEARLRELERSLAEARRSDPTAADSPGDDLPPRRKTFDFTAAERRALARRCLFRWALPRHLTQWAVPSFDQALVLDPAEQAAIIRVLEDQRTEFVENLRAIYIELVGDQHAARTLSPMGLHHEIDGKTPKAEGAEARQLILLEWSQARPAPTGEALRGRPAIERYWRLLVAASDDTIRRLTPVIGPQRARELTRGLVEMGVFGKEPGCPSGEAGERTAR